MKKIQEYSQLQCPVHGLLSVLSGSWTTYILWLLEQRGQLRFGELRRQMPGLSAKVLTERLRKLEEAGLILRHAEATIPPKVTYELSERGKQVQGPLCQLGKLAAVWYQEESGQAAPCPQMLTH